MRAPRAFPCIRSVVVFVVAVLGRSVASSGGPRSPAPSAPRYVIGARGRVLCSRRHCAASCACPACDNGSVTSSAPPPLPRPDALPPSTFQRRGAARCGADGADASAKVQQRPPRFPAFSLGANFRSLRAAPPAVGAFLSLRLCPPRVRREGGHAHGWNGSVLGASSDEERSPSRNLSRDSRQGGRMCSTCWVTDAPTAVTSSQQRHGSAGGERLWSLPVTLPAIPGTTPPRASRPAPPPPCVASLGKTPRVKIDGASRIDAACGHHVGREAWEMTRNDRADNRT